MLFMLEWSLKDGYYQDAVEQFLTTGAPPPEGMELVSRWHAPGSSKGWLLVETNDVSSIYAHASEWGASLNMTATPVVDDKIAGREAAKIWRKDDKASQQQC